MKLHLAAIACIALAGSCDKQHAPPPSGGAQQSGRRTGGFEVTSANAPNSDNEALNIVMISMVPPPEVIFRSYEAGLDDNMKLVLRFPRGRMEEFWTGSPWSKEKAKAASGDDSTKSNPRIPASGDPKWLRWKASTIGISAEASLPDGEAARVYLAEDLEEDFVHAFIFGSKHKPNKTAEATPLRSVPHL